MVHQVIYALRGWIAFVAFIDFGMAIQCFIGAVSFLETQLYTAHGTAEHVNPAMARLLGIYRILNALIMSHCAFCIHHKPILSLSLTTCVLTIVTNSVETFWYGTAPASFYTLFPVFIAVVTIIGLSIAPLYLKPPEVEAEEETQMLKMSTIARRKNMQNKKRT